MPFGPPRMSRSWNGMRQSRWSTMIWPMVMINVSLYQRTKRPHFSIHGDMLHGPVHVAVGMFSVTWMRLGKCGARGFGLRSMRSGKMRHLHPAEGALLCTVPPTFAFPCDLRAALSLLGQIAAPLQVLWLQAHILAGLQLFHWGWTGIDPTQSIQVLQQH